MAVGFVATLTLLGRVEAAPRRYGFWEPLAALRDPGLRMTAIVAVLYNLGFFTLLAYAPYPMRMTAFQLGWVFFGWGLLVAISSVWVAPLARRTIGTWPAMIVNNTALTAVLVVMAVGIDSPALLATCVVVSGLFSGTANTLVTQAVMETTSVDRPVASAGYSFVRFLGGAVAPIVASQLAERLVPAAAFWFGAAGFAAAAVVTLVRTTAGRARRHTGRGAATSTDTAAYAELSAD